MKAAARSRLQVNPNLKGKIDPNLDIIGSRCRLTDSDPVRLRDSDAPSLFNHAVYTMDRRVSCAIAGKDRPLHVDITNCNLVYDLRKAAVDLSRIKIPYVRVDIWKVRGQESYTMVWSLAHSAFYRSRIQDNSLSQMLLH